MLLALWLLKSLSTMDGLSGDQCEEGVRDEQL